jgi:site-specific recombinase XerD
METTDSEQALMRVQRNGAPWVAWQPEVESAGADTIEFMIRRLRDSAGIEDVRCSPHTFRHTFSTKYLEQVGAMEKLSRELGHSKINVTEQYIKTLPLSVARQVHKEFSPIRKLNLTHRRRRQNDRVLAAKRGLWLSAKA